MAKKWNIVNEVAIDEEFKELWLTCDYYDCTLLKKCKVPESWLHIPKGQLKKRTIENIKLVKGSFDHATKEYVRHAKKWVEY